MRTVHNSVLGHWQPDLADSDWSNIPSVAVGKHTLIYDKDGYFGLQLFCAKNDVSTK